MAAITNAENPYMTEAVSVARVISETLSAYRQCVERGNAEWEATWGDILSQVEREALPSGSGIDSGTRIIREPEAGSDADADTCIRLSGSYHAMDSSGMYAGWFDYTIEARAAFSGLSVSLEWAGGDDPETASESDYPAPTVTCPECDGTGLEMGDAGPSAMCSQCDGAGVVDDSDAEWYGVSDPTDYLIDVYHSALSETTTRGEWR